MAQPPILLQLGDFQFGIETAIFQDMQHSAAWRWIAKERFGQMPALQYTGPEAETLQLPGVIYPEFRGGTQQVERMRALAGTGVPQRMVNNSGAYVGRWVIEGIDDKQSAFNFDGQPRKQEFTLKLRRFPSAPGASAPDIASAASAASAVGGVAIPAAATGAVARVNGLAGSIASAAKSVKSTLARVAGQVEQAVGPIVTVARDAIGGVTRAIEVADALQSAANRTLAKIGVQPIETTALNAAQNLAAKAGSLVGTAESASALLRNANTRLAALPAVPAAATAAMCAAIAAADRTATLARQAVTQAETIKG